MVVTCTIDDQYNRFRSYALLDIGATGYAFIDEDFVRCHNLPLFALKKPRRLEVIDGRASVSGDITHLTKVQLTIDKHVETLPMFVTKLGHYPIVLEMPWFRRHDVQIGFAANTVTFSSDYCLEHCCPVPASTKGISTPLPEKTTNISLIAGSAFTRMVSRKRRHQVEVVGSLTIAELKQAIQRLNKPSLANGDNEDNEQRVRSLVPEEFHDILRLFRKALANALPPHRPYDHKIPLKEGFTPPFGPLYNHFKQELEAAWDWLQKNLSKGFIRASSSSAGAPILFAKKKDGSLRLCIDYRGLNQETIKNRYSLPLIRETLNQLSKTRYFTKLDVRDAYNLLRVADEDV